MDDSYTNLETYPIITWQYFVLFCLFVLFYFILFCFVLFLFLFFFGGSCHFFCSQTIVARLQRQLKRVMFESSKPFYGFQENSSSHFILPVRFYVGWSCIAICVSRCSVFMDDIQHYYFLCVGMCGCGCGGECVGVGVNKVVYLWKTCISQGMYLMWI